MRLYLWLAWILALVCGVWGLAFQTRDNRDKPRTIRGFKNTPLSTARGFGKRSFSDPDFNIGPDKESVPVDWFVAELSRNPELSRLVVQKFIDSNQDGDLSADELLRPLYAE
ncbi:allatotropins-like [Lycorma delicatula]|uniref:allatotropins-like n=1 Tax=Lycorma delicatula TaxID=130591 RepID=UPI003F518E04